MSLLYLIENRIKPPILSRIWFKFIAKRIYHIPSVFLIFLYRCRLKFKGVIIGDLSIPYPFEINGRAKNITIGSFTFISKKVHMACHGSIKIGSYVVINDGVKILTSSHYLNDRNWSSFSKEIIIEDYAWIATNSIILPGVTIGKGAVVAAGAVVRSNVPPYSVAIGNPAEIKEKKRITDLDYNPVSLCAPYEAWLGKNKK